MANSNTPSREIALVQILITDVLAARQRLDMSDTPTARRDAVRASLAAMEGMIWLAREHVREGLAHIDALTPTAELALQEQAYLISEQGKLRLQSRGIPLDTAIRFVADQATLLNPRLEVDFSIQGWSDFKQSIAVRNRITHPKPERDMHVSDDELQRVASGLSWVVATVDYIMASTNRALVEYNELARDLVNRLVSGDPEAIAEYQSALQRASGNKT